MAKLDKEAKRIINDYGPSFIATSSKSGEPNITAHGLFHVLDDSHVIYTEIASPRTVTNLKDNPRIAVAIFERSTRKGCRISGGVTDIIDSGALFEDVSKRYSSRGVKIRHVVKIEVENICIFQAARFYFYQPDED